MFPTEIASKDTADSMEHSGSFSAERKTAPHLDTNEGLLFFMNYALTILICMILIQLNLFPVKDLEAVYQETIVNNKHQPPNSKQGCVVYRYGSFSTEIKVVGEFFS